MDLFECTYFGTRLALVLGSSQGSLSKVFHDAQHRGELDD
jgi:hypothetical protein